MNTLSICINYKGIINTIHVYIEKFEDDSLKLLTLSVFKAGEKHAKNLTIILISINGNSSKLLS